MNVKGFIFLAAGIALLWTGWNNWRHRDTDAIPWIEDKFLLSIDKLPLPRTKFDRMARRFHAVFGLIFGFFFGLVGLVLLFDFGD